MIEVQTVQRNIRSITSLAACLAFALFAPTAQANLYEWTNSAGTISVKADLSISGDTLTVQLSNISSQPTADPSSTLTSFYFSINGAPGLTYQSAMGYVIGTGVGLGTADDLGTTAFRADNTLLSPAFVGDGATNYKGQKDGWQFKTMVSFDYGIGTVGNNSGGGLPLGDTFKGADVDGLDLGIIAGDGNSANLKDRYLVQNMATFEFGLPTDGYSYSNADLGDQVAFGFGTAPDNFVVTPLPGAMLLGFMGLSVAGLKLRRHA
jgi:hypothetical protein